jgi:hypothetical protein
MLKNWKTHVEFIVGCMDVIADCMVAEILLMLVCKIFSICFIYDGLLMIISIINKIIMTRAIILIILLILGLLPLTLL